MSYKLPPRCQIVRLPEILEETFGFRETGTFVDVGAYDGRQWSNTWELAVLGWTGICFEPHPTFASECGLNHRYNDKVLVVQRAIADYHGFAVLLENGSISTIDPRQREAYDSVKGWPRDWKEGEEVRVSTLDYELERHGFGPPIDLVSIDVEGMEIDVLAGFDLDHWKPTMLIVETHETRPERALNWKAPIIETRLDFYGYEKIHADSINSIYRRCDEI